MKTRLGAGTPLNFKLTGQDSAARVLCGSNRTVGPTTMPIIRPTVHVWITWSISSKPVRTTSGSAILRTGGGDDSSHVGLDGDGTTSDRIRAPGPNNQWNWNNDRRDGQGIAQFEVASPGAHVVNVWMREDGWRFDKLVLTTAGNFTPADLGPPESGRGPQFTAGGASPDNGDSDVPW